ncbi:MAG: hypothetical protein ACXW15_13520, partial [Acidimicrobiia bacterium]
VTLRAFFVGADFPQPTGDHMERVRAGGAALVFIGALVGAVPVHAQATFGVDLDLFSSYVWRGLSLTNKPVAQPAVWVSFPAGNASVTVGGWANVDLGKYDDPADDISESGGSSAFNLAEFNPYAEVSFPVGRATLTGGATGYIYPNDELAPNDFGLLTSDANTVEIYGKVGLDTPLSPELSIYYDVDKIKGAYFEGSVSHSLAASENVSIDLGALAGFSAGQGISDDPDESSNFDDDGFTHLELSAGVPFTAGIFSITPVLHLVITGDERTKITSPTNFDTGAKLWGGVSFSWSNEVEEEEVAE